MPPDLSSESSTYGHDPENEHVFFYHDNFEVDFYIPDAELAIQVSYSLREEDTRKRETEALQKLPHRLPCSRRIILTYDEEETITDQHGTIEVIPVWKWLLNKNNKGTIEYEDYISLKDIYMSCK